MLRQQERDKLNKEKKMLKKVINKTPQIRWTNGIKIKKKNKKQ